MHKLHSNVWKVLKFAQQAHWRQQTNKKTKKTNKQRRDKKEQEATIVNSFNPKFFLIKQLFYPQHIFFFLIVRSALHLHFFASFWWLFIVIKFSSGALYVIKLQKLFTLPKKSLRRLTHLLFFSLNKFIMMTTIGMELLPLPKMLSLKVVNGNQGYSLHNQTPEFTVSSFKPLSEKKIVLKKILIQATKISFQTNNMRTRISFWKAHCGHDELFHFGVEFT